MLTTYAKLAGTLALVLAFVALQCSSTTKTGSDTPAAGQPTAAQPAAVATTAPAAGVTLAQYEQLTDGITYDAAVAILGEPSQELSRTSVGGITTVMYMWNGAAPASNMNAMFQDGKMVSRSQFGLK